MPEDPSITMCALNMLIISLNHIISSRDRLTSSIRLALSTYQDTKKDDSELTLSKEELDEYCDLLSKLIEA